MAHSYFQMENDKVLTVSNIWYFPNFEISASNKRRISKLQN